MPSTFIAIDFINSAVDERVNALRDTIYINSLNDLDIYITNGSCYRVRMNDDGRYVWYTLTVSTKIVGSTHVPMQILYNNEGYMIRSQDENGDWRAWNNVANIYPIKFYTTVGNNKDSARKYLTLECPKGYLCERDRVHFVRYVRSTNQRNIKELSEETYCKKKKAWKERNRGDCPSLKLEQILNFNNKYSEDRWRIVPDGINIPLADYLCSFHKNESRATGEDCNYHILGKQLGIYIERNNIRISDFIPFRVIVLSDGVITLSI